MIRQGGGSVLSFFRFPLAEPYVSLGGNLWLCQGKRMFPVGKPSKDKRIFLKSQWRFQISLTERYSGVQW